MNGLMLTYFFRVTIQILDKEPVPSATFIIEATQNKNDLYSYPLLSLVMGTLEDISENASQTYIELYRITNWFLRFAIGLSLAPVILILIGIYMAISIEGSIQVASSLVMCAIVLLPIGLWIYIELHYDNRRRFREVVDTLGYQRRRNVVVRAFSRPINWFIQGQSTTPLLLPYAMTDCLRRLHHLRDISKTNPEIERLIVSCPNKVDQETNRFDFQIRRKAEGFGTEELARLEGTALSIPNFADRIVLTATLTRSLESIQ